MWQHMFCLVNLKSWFPSSPCPYQFQDGSRKHMISYILGSSRVQAVENTLYTITYILRTLEANLVKAQNEMKQQVDKHISKCSFEVWD